MALSTFRTGASLVLGAYVTRCLDEDFAVGRRLAAAGPYVRAGVVAGALATISPAEDRLAVALLSFVAYVAADATLGLRKISRVTSG